ncbi:MAG: EAL domain-containing protein [Steroidobacteraceae bacterium]|jgi:EAL domain-containing protein (putative c-di-GMP-specific phosphodiesterase class I)
MAQGSGWGADGSHMSNAVPAPAQVAGKSQPPAEPKSVPAYSYAFQPIVDTVAREVFSYEALIRGPENEPAFRVLQQVPDDLKHQFDQDSRIQAIALAARMGLKCKLNLNFLPRSLELCADAIGNTCKAAADNFLPLERIVLEVTEGEVIDDHSQFAALLNEYRGMGIKLAIDDFGAGYSGLNLLAEFQPDQVKIDMHLVRGIEKHGPRQAIVRGIAQVCADLGIDVIAEGVETMHEFRWFEDHGVRLFQGYLFAKPAFEELPLALYPEHLLEKQ